MRTRVLFFAALILCAVSSVFAQKPASPPAPTTPPAPNPGSLLPYQHPGRLLRFRVMPSSSPTQPQQQPAVPASPVPEQKAPPAAPPIEPTPQAPFSGYPGYAPPEKVKIPRDELGSVYVPMDSWMYPALSHIRDGVSDTDVSGDATFILGGVSCIWWRRPRRRSSAATTKRRRTSWRRSSIN